MTLFSENTTNRLRSISAVYFALLGIGALLADIYFGTVSIPMAIMCAILSLPLIFRRKYVYMAIGYCIAIAFGYFIFAQITWFLKYLSGAYVGNALLTFGFGPLFTIGSFLLAVIMVYTGSKQSFTSKMIPEQL